MPGKTKKAVDLDDLAVQLEEIAANGRIRFDWLRDSLRIQEVFGRPGRAALLVSLDYSRPPNPERVALWEGLEGEIYDLYYDARLYGFTLMQAQAEAGNWQDGICFDPSWRPDEARRWKAAIHLDTPDYYLYQTHLFGAKLTKEELRWCRPTHRAPPGDTCMTWFVRERIPLFAPETVGRPGDAWAVFQKALVRLGLNGRQIGGRPCAGCERPVNTRDPHVLYCRHCRTRLGLPEPQGANVDEERSRDVWKADGFRAHLPSFVSIAEVEREVLRHRALWALSCDREVTFADSRAPDFPRRALDWFSYEGMYSCYDENFVFAGVALTAAESLVREAGYAWRLKDGALFITHPRRPAPVAVDSLLADFGDYYRSPFESEEDAGFIADLESHVYDPWKCWKNAVMCLSHAAWPSLDDEDIRNALRNITLRFDEDEDNVFNPVTSSEEARRIARHIRDDDAWLDATRINGVRIDRERLGFDIWLPEKPGYQDEFSGRFIWREGEGWLAALSNSSEKHQPDEPHDETPVEEEAPPIIAAARVGDIAELMRLLDHDPALIQPVPQDFPRSDGLMDAPLYAAAESGQTEAVRLLLKRGAPTVPKPGYPCPALTRAAALGHADVVATLLEAGVPPEHPLPPPRSDGDTGEEEANDGEEPPADPEAARAWADERMAKVVAEIEEDSLADAEAPLLLAAKNGHADVVRLLLAHGADPHRRVRFAVSPALHAGWFHPGVVDTLLAAGVAIDERDRFGKTALHLAASAGGMIDRLPENIPDSFAREAKLFRSGLEDLLRRGADVNARDEKGETPLHKAAAQGTAPYIAWWLAQGADPTIAAHDGRTPLDEAESADNRAVYDLLACPDSPRGVR